MSKKINLEEIWLNNITKFENIESSTIWDIGKVAMLEAIKQVLELAAENAKINCKLNLQEGKWVQERFSLYKSDYNDYTSCTVEPNKQSILEVIKQVE